VARTAGAKYVQFAADPEVLPPLLFDLTAGPGHVANLAAGGRAGAAGSARDANLALELEMAQEMLRWRMRNMDRALANCYLAPAMGPVWARDDWR
jgi:hypothetical protein